MNAEHLRVLLERVSNARTILHSVESELGELIQQNGGDWKALARSSKISGIKAFKTETGCDLKTAKIAVEAYLEASAVMQG